MGEHDVLGDSQAQACPARLPGTSLVHAVEALKQTRQVFGGNARAKIADKKLYAVFRGPRAQNEAAAASRVLQSIVNQVGKDLVDGFTVGVHRVLCRRLHLQINSMRTSQFVKALDRIMQELSRRQWLDVKTLLSRFHAGKSQQVFGQSGHAVRVFADD